MTLNILLKISGQMMDINKKTDDIQNLLDNIKSIQQSNINLVIVVGGGNIVRGRNQKNSVNRVNYDKIGIMSTVINGIYLHTLLENEGIQSHVFSAIQIPKICDTIDPSRIKKVTCNKGQLQVVICTGGIGVPFVSTDMACVIRALEFDCGQVLKATKVDGVYNKDPFEDKSASMLRQVSYNSYINNNLKVMDLPAIALAKEHLLKIKVFCLKTTTLQDVINNKGVFSLIN